MTLYNGYIPTCGVTLGLVASCNASRRAASRSRELVGLLLQKHVVLMETSHGISGPTPPSQSRFEVRSPRVKHRLRKAAPLGGTAHQDAGDSLESEWTQTALPKAKLYSEGFSVGGWFAGRRRMSLNSSRKMITEEDFLSAAGRAHATTKVQNALAKYYLHLPPGEKKALPDTKGVSLEGGAGNLKEDFSQSFFPQDHLKGFSAVNKSILKLARKFIARERGFRVPVLPLWLIQEDEVGADKVAKSRISKAIPQGVEMTSSWSFAVAKPPTLRHPGASPSVSPRKLADGQRLRGKPLQQLRYSAT